MNVAMLDVKFGRLLFWSTYSVLKIKLHAYGMQTYSPCVVWWD